MEVYFVSDSVDHHMHHMYQGVTDTGVCVTYEWCRVLHVSAMVQAP